MNKKKIISLCTVGALSVATVVGGTLAYFTDMDTADNTFSIGNVQIEIEEEFDENDAQLIPGRDINKDVYVKNVGANDAYVRVHIAIPADMDDGNPEYNASKNFLHFNFTQDSVASGQWSWLPEYTTEIGYRGNGAGNWNFYTATIDEEAYNVYIVTYRSVLKANEKTATQALDKVYLDKTVDAVVSEDGQTITYEDTKGNEVTMGIDETFDIKVFAEAVQSEGFDNAYAAFEASYAPATETANPWNGYGAASE